MSLYRLKIFSTVAKWGSVTKACGEIHISQPAVSRQLRLLEQDCGVKLYKTTGRGIELTKEGHLFLREAQSFLNVEKLLKSFKTKTVDKDAGTLAVGASYGPSASIVPSALATFQEVRPDLKLILRTDSSAAIERLLLNLEIEIAVISRPCHSPVLIYEPYRQHELAFFVSSKHPLAKKSKLTLTDLAKSPFVTLTEKIDEANVFSFLENIRQRGAKLNVIMQYEIPEAVKTAVRTIMAVGILDRDYLHWDLKNGDFKVINVPELRMQYDSFTIQHKGKTASADAQAFLNLLRDHRKSLQSKTDFALSRSFHPRGPSSRP
jgi:DNA-binding transcriptional LysR family regulator